MKKRILLLLTLLLMCVLIPLQKASAQINLDPVTLTVDGDSEKTTTTTDTDDITFTVNVLYLKDLFGFIDLSTTTTVPEGATLTPTLNPTGLNLTQGSDQDVTITAPRTALTVAGTYTIVFTANHDFTFPQRPISTTLTITVERSGVQTYGVTVEVQGSSTQTTTTAGTGDITYTLRVTNTGSGTDSITLTKSDVPTSTLSETSLSSLAANAYEDVTLTVPRSALSSVGTYAVTVTATSDGDDSESDEDGVRTIVNIPAVYGVTLLSISRLEQMTTITDTEDIVYTLKVTNIGTDEDTIGLTKTTGADLATLSYGILTLAAEESQEVTVTFPRSVFTSAGTFRVTVTAISRGDRSKTDEVIMTTTVTDPDKPISRFDTIELEPIGSLSQTTAATDTEDVTYTLLVTNISAFDYFDVELSVSGDIPAATVSPTSVVLFGLSPQLGDTVKEVTLTIPRNALRRAGTFVVTVTADPYFGANKTVTVRTTVTSSELIYGRITLETVSISTQTTTPDATSDVTYTLRLRNNAREADNIDLTVSGDVDTATLSTTSAFLEEDTSQDVILTIPRAALSDVGTYSVTVTATSQDNSAITATVTTNTIITDDPITPTLRPRQTEQTQEVQQTLPEQTTHKVVFSEFMFESEGGENGLPQWIEVYNNSNLPINLRGWELHWKRMQPSLLEVTTTFKEDFTIPVQQSRLIVTSLGRHSEGGKLSDDTVYQLHLLHPEELAQNDIENRNRLIDRGGFSLKLTNPKDVLIDHIGTLTDDKQTWQLHECLIEGVRTSLIRRFDKGVPRSGTERRGWRRASDAKRLVAGIYYGHSHDLGTPAYRRGKPLPVELSQFSARFVKDEVVINWTTESELNNAGFNVLRSTSRTKNFRRINTKLIQGAGTTGERRTYQFIDKTAKPNVAYYYRIEDIDLSGTPGILATYQLRGVISPTGKRITTWGTLKDKR